MATPRRASIVLIKNLKPKVNQRVLDQIQLAYKNQAAQESRDDHTAEQSMLEPITCQNSPEANIRLQTVQDEEMGYPEDERQVTMLDSRQGVVTKVDESVQQTTFMESEMQ